MKHGDPTTGSPDSWHILAADLGITLNEVQVDQLQTYGRWLADEGVTAGGIGPEEPRRLFDRHLADSLTFIAGIPNTATTLLDVGSGVGLPGIPIAIACPQLGVTLIDRSDRRTWLARRACRVLDLGLTVETSDVRRWRDQVDVVTFRASLPIEQAAELLGSGRLGTPTGVFGWSRNPEEPSLPDPPPAMRFEPLCVDSAVLDSPSWLLRMRSTELSI